MKSRLSLFMLCLMLLSGCYKKDHDEHTNADHDARAKDVVKNSENLELYNAVMKIHDESMPQMGSIMAARRELKDRITSGNITDDAERVRIDALIARLDSADQSMRVWMREFGPAFDKVAADQERQYLEAELERIKLVRDKIQTAIDESKAYGKE